MCCTLGGGTITLLLIFLLPTIILFEITLQNDLTRKARAVEDSVINAISLISESNSMSVDQMLDQGRSAAIALALQRAEENRPDTPAVPDASAVPKNMDYASLFAAGEGHYVPRYGGGRVLINPYRSSYHTAGKTPADIPNFSAALNSTIGKRYALDFIPIDMFNQSGGIIGPLLTLYTCVFGAPSAPNLFVDIPARGDTGLAPGYAGYDCANDDWSQQVISATDPYSVQVTTPYFESDVNATIISFVVGVKPFSGSGSLAGTVGVDLAVTSIQDTLAQNRFRNVSSAALFTSDGTFVASSEKQFAVNSNTLAEVLAGVATVDPFVFAGDGSNYVVAHSLPTGFVHVIFAPRSLVDDLTAAVRAENRKQSNIYIIVIVLSFAFSIGLVWAVIRYFSRRASVEAKLLSETVSVYARRHLGVPDAGRIPPPTLQENQLTVTEFQEVLGAYRAAIPRIDDSRTAIAEVPLNPMFGKMTSPVINLPGAAASSLAPAPSVVPAPVIVITPAVAPSLVSLEIAPPPKYEESS